MRSATEVKRRIKAAVHCKPTPPYPHLLLSFVHHLDHDDIDHDYDDDDTNDNDEEDSDDDELKVMMMPMMMMMMMRTVVRLSWR